MLFIMAWFPIAYAGVGTGNTQVFDWLLALSGLSTIFVGHASGLTLPLMLSRPGSSLPSPTFAFARRGACKDIPSTSCHFGAQAVGFCPPTSGSLRTDAGVWGSYTAIVILLIFLVAQFYVGLDPIGPPLNGAQTAKSWFLAYLGLPILV
jgi:amino acid transporter